MKLPINDSKELIIDTVRNNQVTVLVGETGSGKTTQLPVFFYEAGLVNGGMLGVTQPRRIAATSVAEYVAGQFGGKVGEVVGYQVRFDDLTADQTKIKFMTDGILLRELQNDPNLSKYSMIMVDEAHERSQNIDFVLGLLKDLIKRRSDLKVIVTSATIDQEKFSRYFGNAPIINVSGRTYPVEIVCSDRAYRDNEMMDAIAEKITTIHAKEKAGDILVFVSGIDDINNIIETVEEKNIKDLVLLPAHGSLDPAEQKKIFAEYPGMRKVVVATNVAETSITLDGTVYVIDSGLVKQTNFHAESGIQSLDLMEHSQAGCNQRSGRAGRTQAGVCYRMYTEESFMGRQPFTTPEIMRSSLANVVLMMEDIGIDDVEGFDFVDQPDKETFHEAYETLIALGAIKKGQKGLTDLGRSMAKLPLEPRIARMLLEAEKHDCVEDVATVSAFLSARNVFARPKGKERLADASHYQFKNPQSDVLTFLSVWKAYENSKFSHAWCFNNYLNVKTLEEISKIRKQILGTLPNCGIRNRSGASKPDDVMKAVAMGLVYNLFVSSSYVGYSYRGALRNVSEVFVHPGSSVFGRGNAPCMVAAKVMQTSKNFAHVVTYVQIEWLRDMVPHLCTYGGMELNSFEPSEGVVHASREVTLCDRMVGKESIKLSIAEAYAIQQKKIERAEEKGLVPLKLKVVVGGYANRLVTAVYEGEVIRVFGSYSIEDGDVYYCKIESFMGDTSAETVFKVLDLPIKKEIIPVAVMGEQSGVDMSQLLGKWGRKH